MSIDKIHSDFSVYTLETDGTFNELEMEQSEVSDYLDPEEVLLLIRQDLRRLFIWKGPKSPVRKRFISSRVAAQIQSDLRDNGGRYLKIISVDAGDETIEFLSAFNLEPYQVTEVLADMHYIRNTEREKLKQEELKKKFKKEEKSDEYWSPILEEMKKLENGEKKQEPVKKIKTPKIKSVPIAKRKQKSKQPMTLVPRKNTQLVNKDHLLSESDQRRILNDILLIPPPVNMKRMNIIIGNALYAPSSSISMVLGKKVEKESWEIVEPPTGVTDILTNKIRVIVDENSKIINAIEIFQTDAGIKIASKNTLAKKTTKKSTKVSKMIKKINNKKKSTRKKPKRTLPKIPSGN
jgi:hypothetical protein